MPFEVRVDCPSCRVEGARVETWETDAPSCRLGVPLAARCRLCGHAGQGQVAVAPGTTAPGAGCPACGAGLDEASLAAHRCPQCGVSAGMAETSPGRVPGTPGELSGALGAWAVEEGLASAAELIEACFVLATPAAVLAALARGETVETTFDVVDFLFSSGHGQGGAGAEPVARVDAPPPLHAAGAIDPRLQAPAQRAPTAPGWEGAVERTAPWSVRVPASLRRMGGPRDELLALASVAASDGEASQDDLELLAQAAQARGIPPLPMEDIRVRRPGEIDPPPTLIQREKLLEEMFHMAWSDDELDESEIRVIRDFARAWGVDPQRITEWAAAATLGESIWIIRWLDRIGYFFFPGW